MGDVFNSHRMRSNFFIDKFKSALLSGITTWIVPSANNSKRDAKVAKKFADQVIATQQCCF